MSEFDNPQSRTEAVLQNMLGADNELSAPTSRIEDLLQQILEQGGSGGGGTGAKGDPGAPCKIDSITPIEGGNRITFSWTNDNGTKTTSTLDVMDGEDGAQGPQGQQGIQGETGIGVPSGGTTGQVLAKASNTDYDTQWQTVSGGQSSDGVPIGTIISIMGLTAPSLYLPCDGEIYDINDYPLLAQYFEDQFGYNNYFGGDGVYNFAVPDLRGEFLRGTGTNSHTNQGDGGSVGDHQDGTSHPYWYVWTDYVGGSQRTRFNVRNKTANVMNQGPENVEKIDSRCSYFTQYDSSAVEVSENSMYASYTSRPTNTSVLYCIKYS